MKWSLDIGTLKNDNPSATVHGEAFGAVHTYAMTKKWRAWEKKKSRAEQRNNALGKDTDLFPIAVFIEKVAKDL